MGKQFNEVFQLPSRTVETSFLGVNTIRRIVCNKIQDERTRLNQETRFFRSEIFSEL